ncbi:hypothetical protein DFJ58DRAFT_846195 [Suillus subalutaceus]|uniref:uncharacterized protein n=1 Tax=Suillus subalutaceus TaxID=48586 RepID=UPI001B860CA8|nr:uncharacterized protein DFJ58DRAFT_846195 [Suillus subalutaceus]KAG1838162.1 hypothetical protein DFJ58DRAFT_846195 [Suillus subalutaceus]
MDQCGRLYNQCNYSKKLSRDSLLSPSMNGPPNWDRLPSVSPIEKRKIMLDSRGRRLSTMGPPPLPSLLKCDTTRQLRPHISTGRLFARDPHQPLSASRRHSIHPPQLMGVASLLSAQNSDDRWKKKSREKEKERARQNAAALEEKCKANEEKKNAQEAEAVKLIQEVAEAAKSPSQQALQLDATTQLPMPVKPIGQPPSLRALVDGMTRKDFSLNDVLHKSYSSPRGKPRFITAITRVVPTSLSQSQTSLAQTLLPAPANMHTVSFHNVLPLGFFVQYALNPHVQGILCYQGYCPSMSFKCSASQATGYPLAYTAAKIALGIKDIIRAYRKFLDITLFVKHIDTWQPFVVLFTKTDPTYQQGFQIEGSANVDGRMESLSGTTSPSNLDREWTAETGMWPLIHTGSGRRTLHYLLSLASSPTAFPYLGLVSSRSKIFSSSPMKWTLIFTMPVVSQLTALAEGLAQQKKTISRQHFDVESLVTDGDNDKVNNVLGVPKTIWTVQEVILPIIRFTLENKLIDALAFRLHAISPNISGLLRPGYTTSNVSSSTCSSNTPPHHSYHPPPSISSSARTNASTRESDEFSSGSLASIPQDVHRGSSSGSSNLLWGAPTSSRPSPPIAPSPDLLGRRLQDILPIQILAGDRVLALLGDSISQFYAADEERPRVTLNTIQDNDSSPSRSADRYQEVAARARTVIERSCNSVHPLSAAFSSFSREQGFEDSDEAELSFDRYVEGLSEEDSMDNERRRRVMAHNRYDLAGKNDEDDDDPSHSDSVHEIIQGLHNARGLPEHGVETGKPVHCLGHLPAMSRPIILQLAIRLHSCLHSSATTVSSNSLVSESAAEHRRTNARAHLRSQLFASRTSSDEPPQDSSDISSLTAAARLRCLIASQTDSSSTTSSHPLSSGRTSDLPSRPFASNGPGSPSQFPRGGLNEWERARFSKMLSKHRHPQTRSGTNRSLSRDRNHLSSEDSPDSIFDPVFALINAIPDSTNSAEGDVQPPYVLNGDTSGRSNPSSSVNLDMFPPGIYHDSLRWSIQANQARGDSRVPEPELMPPVHEPSTMFSFGNSDEDNDSDGMDSYFAFGISPRRGRERTAATSARFTSRHMMPEPAAPATSLAFGIDSHNTSMQGHSAFTGVQSVPLDPFWSSSRRDAPAHDPPPSGATFLSLIRDPLEDLGMLHLR